MTVAHIREPKGAEDVEVVFLESARFYKLPRAHPSFDRILRQLRFALARGHLAQVRLTSPHGDVIEDVELA